jgi:regulation of enolase protein 1 (concanavalin A-like superfamily)
MRWVALLGVPAAAVFALAALAVAASDEGDADGAEDGGAAVTFRDTFKPKPADGWTWLREDPAAWRVGEHGLEVRVQPGNMWGPANDAKNVLLRAAPDPAKGPVEVTASVENAPTGQWEQVDLVWYYDDGHMVKLGQELVDGQLSVVMGREHADRTRTIAIIPLDSNRVDLRLLVDGAKVKGRFKPPGGEWRDAGECDVPALEGKPPQVSLQFYMGPPDAEHWARVSEVTIRSVGKPASSGSSGAARL